MTEPAILTSAARCYDCSSFSPLSCLPTMRSALRTALAADAQWRTGRARSNSLSTVPPAPDSADYLPELAAIAATILYRSPLPSKDGRPVYILNAAAFPDAFEVDYDSLLSYVLARLPGEDELIAGTEYEIVFFAGGPPDNATAEKKQGPATGWYLQAYHVLGRALRKKLAMLYIVHPRTWVRVLLNIFGTIVSPKFRRKIVHVNCLTSLALHIPIEHLLTPPSAYLQDRKYSPNIYSPFVTGRRAFSVKQPFPRNIDSGRTRLPRALRETTAFLVEPSNLKTEGIFRIPPHSVLVGVLREAYDRGQKWIVWKDQGATFVQPGLAKSLVDEIRLEDAYGVHSAASLIKTWYRELREPVFPESCYATLRERYSDPDTELTPEDMVDIILPTSSMSPLPPTSREILTRHLLPLLSLVASHEPHNKMGAENLAICFAMCLVCGSDQMADAKISSIVKRILVAAIDMWPQLRAGIDIEERAFYADLSPPIDPNEYEDPLEALRRPSDGSDASSEKSQIGHRISMNESDSSDSSSEKPPALPPRRRSRATSLKAALAPHLPNVELPKLPRRNKAAQREPSPSAQPGYEPASDAAYVGAPPRYSSLFDYEGRNLPRSDSPGSYAPIHAGGVSPPKSNDASMDLLDDSRAQKPIHRRPVGESSRSRPVSTEIIGSIPGITGDVPKRKPVSRQTSVKGENRPAETALHNDLQTASTSTAPENTSQNESTTASQQNGPVISSTSSSSPSMPFVPPGTHALLAEMAARQAANNVTQNNVIDIQAASASTNSATNAPRSAPGDLAVKPPHLPTSPSSSANAAVFRKPSWQASAANKQRPDIQSLAKPILPTRTSNTAVPLISTANVDGASGGAVQHVPKPRAPSAGLLNRMNSWESRGSTDSQATSNSAKLEPRRLDLKKSSVDDLRRLYEERATTATTLVQLGRRASSKH
ncbi:Caytaxin [Cercospora beticola]|uniref:Caytaxin n=2 Tax=Cercospora beticola TaxID=122368 RepID=A0A2G5HKK0_CERBT|nr:Caytaxin [Cercospora beticola]PIA92733.1 Caytaxin [Cercospora beticola]